MIKITEHVGHLASLDSRGPLASPPNNQANIGEFRIGRRMHLPRFVASQDGFPSDCLADALLQAIEAARVVSGCPRSVRVLEGQHGSS